MPKNLLVPKALIATALAVSSAASHGHGTNPFEAETYKQCVALGSVGVSMPIGLRQVMAACREGFPTLPSLRDPDFEGDIYCSFNGGDESSLYVTPTTIMSFPITRRDNYAIKATDPDWDFFTQQDRLMENHPDLEPGATINLDINTGTLKIQSTTVGKVQLEYKCQE